MWCDAISLRFGLAYRKLDSRDIIYIYIYHIVYTEGFFIVSNFAIPQKVPGRMSSTVIFQPAASCRCHLSGSHIQSAKKKILGHKDSLEQPAIS